MIPRHVCEKCLGYMCIEKTSAGYCLKCPDCEEAKNKEEDGF